MAKQEVRELSAKQTPSGEGFVTRWPLYSPAAIETFLPPPRISFHCVGRCKKETTWSQSGNPNSDSIESLADSKFHWVWYVCMRCNQQYLLVFYQHFDFEERKKVLAGSSITSPPRTAITRVSTKVIKIGQYPPQSIEIPNELRKNLGEQASGFYRKALLNRNQGFGLGAISYVRRVVEDKTDELIEAAAQLAESHKIEADVIAKMREAKTAKIPYEDKLKLASTVLPDVLLIDGINPLGALYDLVSRGIHELSEEDCLAIADETREVFELTFKNLKTEVEARKDFAEKVRKLTKWKSPTPAQK